MLRVALRIIFIGICLLAITIAIHGGLDRTTRIELAHADEPPPADSLPELTPEGIAWAHKVIQNSIKLVLLGGSPPAVSCSRLVRDQTALRRPLRGSRARCEPKTSYPNCGKISAIVY